MIQHQLYRFWGHDGALLYIGISHNPGSRFSQHRADKPWWDEIGNITLETHPSREAVLAAERAAIEQEHPHYNVVHNRPGRRASAPKVTAAEMPDCCHDVCTDVYDDLTMYFPHRWDQGVAQYECKRGHRWTCGWGHKETGTGYEVPRPEPRVCRHIWVEPGIGGRLECCDCNAQVPRLSELLR